MIHTVSRAFVPPVPVPVMGVAEGEAPGCTLAPGLGVAPVPALALGEADALAFGAGVVSGRADAEMDGVGDAVPSVKPACACSS